MFDSLKAFHHVESITAPRAAGTEGEKRAREYCVEMLRSAGVSVHEHPFSFSALPDMLFRLVPFGCGIVLWIISMLFTEPSRTAAGILTGMLFAAIIISRLPIPLGILHDIFSYLKSSNVTGHIPASEKMKRQLVFMAHYDSKSQALPIAVRALCIISLILSALILLLSHVVAFYTNGLPYRIIATICGYSALACSVLLLFNYTGNRSPGASDNAAGVAVLLELARVFSLQPLRNIQVSVLFTGAEEYGMAGAYRYVESQSGLESNTQFINIDGVGGNVSVAMIGHSGKSFHRTGSTLTDGLTTTARTLSLHIVKFTVAVGIGFDHIAAASRGYEAVTLCSRSLRMLFRIHSPRDTIDKVSSEAISSIGKLCETYVRELDSRS